MFLDKRISLSPECEKISYFPIFIFQRVCSVLTCTFPPARVSIVSPASLPSLQHAIIHSCKNTTQLVANLCSEIDIMQSHYINCVGKYLQRSSVKPPERAPPTYLLMYMKHFFFIWTTRSMSLTCKLLSATFHFSRPLDSVLYTSKGNQWNAIK